jgi:spore coat protein CotH
MDVDVDSLARMLAGRMTAVVPDGFRVEAADGMLWYSAEDGKFPGQLGDYRVGMAGTYVRDNFAAHGDTAAERIEGAAAQGLDDLQDYVDEATHDPWPGERTPPQACAEIRGTLLHLWYGQAGTSGHVDLACEPIPLASIQRAG